MPAPMQPATRYTTIQNSQQFGWFDGKRVDWILISGAQGRELRGTGLLEISEVIQAVLLHLDGDPDHPHMCLLNEINKGKIKISVRLPSNVQGVGRPGID